MLMRKTETSRPAHQTLRQQGGTGEDGHIRLADWTFSVAEIEKKKPKREQATRQWNITVRHCGRLIVNLGPAVRASLFSIPDYSQKTNHSDDKTHLLRCGLGLTTLSHTNLL